MDPPQCVQRGVGELVEAALTPRNLCMMDPTAASLCSSDASLSELATPSSASARHLVMQPQQHCTLNEWVSAFPLAMASWIDFYLHVLRRSAPQVLICD
uniref:Uncharacterized protein n=1 Tax=Solanum lycopersicum TaxID=4081 RepID=A0A3Q7FU66_SOLLC